MIFINESELYQELMKNLERYHPSENFDVIEKAYKIASDAHKNQFRKSGEPYIIHPLSVAIILSNLELDLESIAAGILHDIIEDTDYTYDDIKNIFGQEIADLVDGVTKLDKIEYVSKEELQAENYRKMFMAMAKDIRVVLIKIADRLHNMRTLIYVRPEKQKRIAQETLDIYAPIAHRLGISKIRYQLEDLSFYYLNTNEYNELSKKIKLCQEERIAYVEKIIEQVKTQLEKYDIEAKVEGRPKHFFSIYKKMISKNKTFDQIYDLFAVRAIVNTVHDCYAVLGIIHEMYKPIPGRFKDYIAMPKSNMYQSLHSTLIGPDGEPFEIQIRTKQMHRVAEYGIAAHWKYKAGAFNNNKQDSEKAKLEWLKQILEWQKELNDNKDYLNALKFDLNIYQSHVYCFSPRGEVISLLSGSTPIDFAYAIHSAVGNKMVGAKVNGKIMPIDYVLKTGDRVEIITSQNSTGPKLNWLKIVKTSHARNKIHQWFKQENKIENIQRGKEILEREAKKKNVSLVDLLIPSAINLVLAKYNFNNFDTIYAAIGHGAIKEGIVINKLYEEYKKVYKIEDAPKKTHMGQQNKKSQPIIVNGVGDVNVRFSKCCSPVPGDEIVGFITRGRGISLHRTDCKNIINLDEYNRQRLIEAHWHTEKENANYYTQIKLICEDITGILASITKLLANEKIILRLINSHSNKSKVIFDIGLEIGSRQELENLCNKLLQINGVNEINRDKNN